MFHNVVDLKAVPTDMMAEGQMVAELPTTVSRSQKVGPETSL